MWKGLELVELYQAEFSFVWSTQLQWTYELTVTKWLLALGVKARLKSLDDIIREHLEIK
jgi:hypothetical protein